MNDPPKDDNNTDAENKPPQNRPPQNTQPQNTQPQNTQPQTPPAQATPAQNADAENTNSARKSAAGIFAWFSFGLILIGLIGLTVCAFAGWFYWDDEYRHPIFLWSAFLFFVTKGPAVKLGGATVLGLLAALLAAAAELFESRRAVRNLTILGGTGILVTLILWIKISQDEVFGEISALAGSAFVEDPPEARVTAVSTALDYAMGALLVWWLIIVATVLGLRAAFTADRLQAFFRLFGRSGGSGG